VRFERRSATDVNDHAQAWVPLIELLQSTDEEVLAAYGRWYIADRNPIWLRRNALIALGNCAARSDEQSAAVLRHYLGHAEPMLRAHAVWAAARIGHFDMLPTTDPDPIVLEELAAVRR
jgi:epoxyqueuosine reductase QueG